MPVGRNDPCPCGSGRKFKKCCHRRRDLAAELSNGPQHTTPTPTEIAKLVDLFHAGRYAELETLALLFIQLHPMSGLVWKVLGATLYAQGKDALLALKKSTELLPKDAEAFQNLGNELRRLGHYHEAIVSYRRAIAVMPDYAEAHNNLGVVLHLDGQHDEAIASYRKAIGVNPNYGEAYANLGVSLQTITQLDEAVTSMRRAIEINPADAAAYKNLGGALQSLGNLEDAARNCLRAL